MLSRVLPLHPTPHRPAHSRSTKPTMWDLIECVFDWAIWALLTSLVGAQFLGLVSNTTTSQQHMLYGQRFVDKRPTPMAIAGDNDEPYTDRSIVCMAEGRSYVPQQLDKVLADASLTRRVDRQETFLHGLRVVQRTTGTILEMDVATYDHYVYVCGRIADTLDAIQDSCGKMGYNVTRDALRIIDGLTSQTVQLIPRALPVLVLPFWDNALFAHHALPGYDGHACDVRLVGKYEDASETHAVIRGVDRSIHDAKTREWLGIAAGESSGVWRNGWLEQGNTSNQRWFANFQSTRSSNELGILVRQFNGIANVEYDCLATTNPPIACSGIPVRESWGTQFSVTEQVDWYHQVAISNGSRFGVFTYEAAQSRVVQATYTLETFISNVSLLVLLVHWLVGLLTLLNSYNRGVSKWYNAGLGCISCARSFNLLGVALLPRLKFIMAAFWTVGCEFEGQQKALSEAWFAIYPGIAEFVLFYFSLLNFVAKLTHRRVSDALFGPTLLFFCVMHRVRLPLAQSGWFAFDGRISTLILSDEMETLRLTDFFTPSIIRRMNGNVLEFVYIKLVVLALNALPLLWADKMTTSGTIYRSCPPCEVEKSLAVRASYVGGLGRSPVYERDSDTPADLTSWATIRRETSRDFVNDHGKDWGRASGGDSLRLVGRTPSDKSRRPRCHTLASYELNRLGYVVFGGKYLLTYDDWYILSSLAPFRIVEKLWNHRVIVFNVTKESDGYYVSRSAELCRLDDERLRAIPFYEVTVCAFR